MKNITILKPQAIKLENVEITEEFMDYKKVIDKIQRQTSSLIERWIAEDKIDKLFNKYLDFKVDIWDAVMPSAKKPDKLNKRQLSLRQLRYQPDVKKILQKELGEDYENLHADQVCQILWHVVERYKSFINRNEDVPSVGITLKENKAMYFKDSGVRLNAKDKTLEFKTVIKKKNLTLPYGESKYNNELLIDGDWRGGNLAFNSLTLAADNEFIFYFEEGKNFESYTKNVIGIDVNQKIDNWCAFNCEISNGTNVLEKPEEIVFLDKKVTDYNKKVRPPKGTVVEFNLNSAQKRKMYRRLQKVYANRKTEIEKALVPELNFLKAKYNNELSFAIDAVATGKSSGSFGQEDIRDIIVRWCWKNEVSFVIVPPQYTSQKCPDCGSFTKQNRAKSNEYKCDHCGYHNENCDIVGAINIADHGKFLLQQSDCFGTSLTVKFGPKRNKELASLYSKELREKFDFPSSQKKIKSIKDFVPQS